MDNRDAIARELSEIEHHLKELLILYEQYFAGVEKREPIRLREQVTRQLRRFANRRIVQTDLRFRYQSLAVRLHTYAGHWDRLLRLLDEGRLSRQPHAAESPAAPPAAAAANEVDGLYREFLAVRETCKMAGPPLGKEEFDALLGRQKEKLRARFGDRELEFRVVAEEGRPRIKVRPKGGGGDAAR